MKLLVLCALFAVVAAAPEEVQILRYEVNNDINAYGYDFELSDGTKRNENGELKNVGSEDEFLAMKGSYSWVGPDGVTYTVTYVADENGFQPTIEQGPGGSVPSAVVASLLDWPIDFYKMAKGNGGGVNTGEMVLSAIKKLMRNTGWTARTIIKFIRMEYRVSDPKISRKVSRALKRGVRLGLLQMERGRYRLNDMSRLAKPVSAREIRMRNNYRTRQRERPLRVRSRTPSLSSRLDTYRTQRRS